MRKHYLNSKPTQLIKDVRCRLDKNHLQGMKQMREKREDIRGKDTAWKNIDTNFTIPIFTVVYGSSYT